MYYDLLSQSGFSMDRLANFCAVADEGSIIGASRGDPIRQSLISRQIRELESFFGVELVRRKGRGLELTQAGKELAAVGRENFKGLSDFASRCKDAEWSVRIVASNSVAYWLVLKRLQKIRASAGNVRYQVFHEQTHEMVTGTREGIFDIGFVRKDAISSGLRYAVLGVVGHSLLIPKAFCRVCPKSAAAALSKHPVALPVGGRMREQVEMLAQKANVDLNITISCSSYLHAAQVLESELCTAVLPEIAFSSLKMKNYHSIPLPDKYTLCLAWSARNADTRPQLAKLIEAFRVELSV